MNGRTLRALVPRWALRWCAPALLLLVVLVAQPTACPTGHHQLDGAPSVTLASVPTASVSTASVSLASVSTASAGGEAVGSAAAEVASEVAASSAVSDFRHGPICHESSAGDLLRTQSHPARTSMVKTAPESSAPVTSAAGPPVSGPPTSSPSSATAPSGRAILLAIGIARS